MTTGPDYYADEGITKDNLLSTINLLTAVYAFISGILWQTHIPLFDDSEINSKSTALNISLRLRKIKSRMQWIIVYDLMN